MVCLLLFGTERDDRQEVSLITILLDASPGWKMGGTMAGNHLGIWTRWWRRWKQIKHNRESKHERDPSTVFFSAQQRQVRCGNLTASGGHLPEFRASELIIPPSHSVADFRRHRYTAYMKADHGLQQLLDTCTEHHDMWLRSS